MKGVKKGRHEGGVSMEDNEIAKEKGSHEHPKLKCDKCGCLFIALIKVALQSSGKLANEEWWCYNCTKKNVGGI